MKRTTISLPDELASAVARAAERRRTSVSAVARDALEEYLGLAGNAPRSLPFAALGGSGRRTTARDVEEILEREWDARDR